MDATDQTTPNQPATDAGPTDEPFRTWIDRDIGQRIAKRLGAGALAVYWGLACHRPNVYPSQQTLADELGMSRAAVKRWLKLLESERYIELKHTAGAPTTYLLCDDTENGGSKMTPLPEKVVQNRTGGEVIIEPAGGSKMNPKEDKGRKTRKEDKARRAAAALNWPPQLDCIEGRQAWERWLAYRHKRRLKPLLTESEQAQLDESAAWGLARFVAAVSHSIARGYQGLFEPARKGNRSPNGPSDDPRGNLARAARLAMEGTDDE